MRHAFVNVQARHVSLSAWQRRCCCAFPKRVGGLFFCTFLGILAIPSVVFAESAKSDSAESRTVSSAKPVVVLPRESTPKQQAKSFIGVGPIFGFTKHIGAPVQGVLGLELSYVRYPYASYGFGIGGFVQAQTVGFDHGRFAFGPQFNFMMFGAEVGAYVEEASGNRAMTVGLHASPFVSIGFFSAALRIAVPIGTLNAGDPYGIDLGLVCAAKLPIPLDGQLFGLAFH
jgi:hypothetical protein